MNKLINETSPYLLQHAHNPVNWYPWGDEALQLATLHQKPILVSIGYSACHWCHVMEKESFEDFSTASLMNELFVNIKIDREERPDLDHIYMDAVQNMTGSGGWPLNVFLTPDGKPFYGGTYYPPRRAHNRASWKEVLQAVADAWQNKRNDVLAQAENLTSHLTKANNFGITIPGAERYDRLFTKENLQTIAENILQTADTQWGGFGRAPKFPQTYGIQFLLRHYHFTGHQPSLKQALVSIDKMAQGGIYDHLGGGFARYSTDNEWQAPHFEKMLYDNALLVSVISEAYQLTGNKAYAEVIAQTLGFIEREMLSQEHGFYSALDADSEVEEGRFYVWDKKEVDELLGQDADLFCKVYNITKEGNWEHSNIIWLTDALSNSIAAAGTDESVALPILKASRQKLLAARAKRVRPGLDDKLLTGWNALMITACCKAYAALGNVNYLQLAENCMAFLESACSLNGWKHTYKGGAAKYPAFLDDCAYLIQAYLNLQEVTGNQVYIEKAKQLTEIVLTDFTDEEQLFFYFTPAGQEGLIVRKKEIYDGATPSGNAVMAQNLYYLSVILNMQAWRARAEAMVASMGQVLLKHPVSFGCWASVLQNMAIGLQEIAIVGPASAAFMQQLNARYMPNKVMQASVVQNEKYPLLQDKPVSPEQTFIYLCHNYACQRPINNVEDFGLLVLNAT
jgi:uncharacterized protein YyaL (SSP411 family)